MANGESDIAKVREAILHYLQNNANAADSLEGVMNWWLPPAYEKVDVAGVEQILEQLIVEGLVRKTSLVDGTILYRQKKP
jgi:Fe2+ or Zn2+ uptake regulation protein